MLIFPPSNPFFFPLSSPFADRCRGNTNPRSFLSPQSFHPIRLTLVTPTPPSSAPFLFPLPGTNHPQPIPCQPLPPTKRHGSHGGSYGINKSGAHAPQLPSLLPSAATSRPSPLPLARRLPSLLRSLPGTADSPATLSPFLAPPNPLSSSVYLGGPPPSTWTRSLLFPPASSSRERSRATPSHYPGFRQPPSAGPPRGL